MEIQEANNALEEMFQRPVGGVVGNLGERGSLKDHPRNCKWLGSPPFTSHEVRPFGRGPTTLLRGLTITMVINHLLNGMIIQEGELKK